MNFFEQQDRSRRATRMLVGLFTSAVLFTGICIYFAVMLAINTSSLRSVVFGDRACQQISAQINTTPILHAIEAQTLIPFIPSANIRDPQIKSSGSSSRSSSFGSNSSRSSSPRSRERSISNFGNRSNNSSYRHTMGADPTDRSNYNSPETDGNCRPQKIWGDLQVFFWTLLGTTSVMGGASWWKINKLQAGGAVIAAELGGIRVLAEIASPEEQQLLNIVEEMAIAATIAVPPVYLLTNELGINAFAAGFTINDAVIGVTRGSLEQLTRDELQGVIAHEFSHILNGDMAMNIRLMGMLHGILCLHLMGRVLSYTESSRENPLWVFGILLRIIGFSGLISGRLIQSAISRQREFLADASAVQFTRNANGIASALEKIGGFNSYIASPHAETASHMFFSPALNFSWLEGLFATHPPIAQRIQIVRGAGRKLGSKIVVNGQVVPTFKSIERIGTIGFASTNAATPNSESSPVAGVYGALAYIYTLLLDRHLSADQLAYLAQLEEPSVLEQIETLRSTVEVIPPHQRLATLDRQLAKIRDTEHAPRLLKCAYGMVELLPPTDWHTAIVYLILDHRLIPLAGNRQEIYHSIAVPEGTFEDVWAEIINILGTLTRLSSDRTQNIDYTFKSSLLRLPKALSNGTKLPPELNWREFQTDLLKIACAAPKVKKALITACLEILTNQRQIPPDGADLMRSIAILLDCPIPPLIERLALTDGNRISTHQRTHS
jgi:Zn-dependent protease with chaperone function